MFRRPVKKIWKYEISVANFVIQSAFDMNSPKDDLQHIRQMMERSSRFISLSGLSGVVAGIIALIGAAVALYLFKRNGVEYFDGYANMYNNDLVKQLVVLGLAVLVLALASGVLFTVQKNKKQGLTIWNNVTKDLLVNLAVPLIAGGLFCVALLYHGAPAAVAPATLVFYGLALVNTSKYTYSDVQYLGYCEIFLGLVAMFLIGYGLIFWALGFGMLHIVYGLVMYRKYK